ncbi:MAG: hypothetical protein HY704_16440 [Gemmatimonadetes bacterium]|nr:hypothetical protein [Gemmatimonadota bacterium]
MRDQTREMDLEDRFARLRAEDRSSAPALDGLLSKARPRRATRSPAPALAALTAVATAACALLVVAIRRERPESRGASPGSQQVSPSLALPAVRFPSPTDFLLDTPGVELLASIPALGWSRGWYPLGPDPEQPLMDPDRRDGSGTRM